VVLTRFQFADVTPIRDALLRDCDPAQIVSVYFRATMPPVRTLNATEQWLRLRGILGCREVYESFGIKSLPIDVPATFNYATGLETIGTLANLLVRGGIHRKFVDDYDEAISLSRNFLDNALLRQYDSVEAYSSRDPWCGWFVGEQILDETVLIGQRDEWWLIAVTGTD
jgi:hypothetical protein